MCPESHQRLTCWRRRWTFAFLLIGMSAGTAWANLITPAAGQCSGGDSYVVGDTSEYCAVWMEQPPFTGVYAGLVEWAFEIPGLTVLENPTSPLPCDWPIGIQTGPPLCYNDEYFFSADGLALGVGAFGFAGGVVIDDSGGDPLATMWFGGCGPEAVCSIQLLAKSGGGPINLATAPVPFDALAAPIIVAVGGAQDAINVSFYNGASASYAFVLATPEPASVFLMLASALVALAVRLKRKHVSDHRNSAFSEVHGSASQPNAASCN